jgi:anti-sigma28 factor (negative regulator of flagellin synthesis)
MKVNDKLGRLIQALDTSAQRAPLRPDAGQSTNKTNDQKDQAVSIATSFGTKAPAPVEEESRASKVDRIKAAVEEKNYRPSNEAVATALYRDLF